MVPAAMAPKGKLLASQIAEIASIILTEPETAKRINRPPKTLERWRRTGEGPPFLRLGRRVAYRSEDVERWLAERTFASRAAELAQRRAAE